MKSEINLVSVPGLLCDGDLWADQCAHLADIAGCRVAERFARGGGRAPRRRGFLPSVAVDHGAARQPQAVTALLRQWLLYD